MDKSFHISEISSSEWFSLNQFLYDVKQINSSCISVYYPYGKGDKIISLFQETKRNESFEKIELKIEKTIKQLKDSPISEGKFTKTLCIFGWIQNGKVNIKKIGISKKLPYIYMASKKPYLKPFSDILKINHDVLLVTLDQKTARIQKFHGSQIVQESKLRIDLQGRHRKGGQSQGRFLRARQTKIHVFYKKVAKKEKTMDDNSELLLLPLVASPLNDIRPLSVAIYISPVLLLILISLNLKSAISAKQHRIRINNYLISSYIKPKSINQNANV